MSGGTASNAEQAQVFQNLQAQLRSAAQGEVAAVAAAQQQEAANFSDTTASAAGSDDEGEFLIFPFFNALRLRR